MADLTEEQQLFIVQRLACFLSPTEVAEDVEEEFGIKIDRTQVRTYNPLQCKPAKKWIEIFHATRKQYLESTAEIGISHQIFRLDQAARLLRKAGRNIALKRDILEYAAKEVGGAFTNKRQLDGNLHVSVDEILGETDEWKEEIARKRKKSKREP